VRIEIADAHDSPSIPLALVTDASVVAKWFLDEEHRIEARSIRGGQFALAAPDFLIIELGSIFAKKIRRGEFSRANVAPSFSVVQNLVEFTTARYLLDEALSLAVLYRRSFYDSLYVALAIREGCQLVTADQRLYNALRPALPETMLWVGDVPSPA
jgi:predicted nucleic acid-binding protein